MKCRNRLLWYLSVGLAALAGAQVADSPLAYAFPSAALAYLPFTFVFWLVGGLFPVPTERQQRRARVLSLLVLALSTGGLAAGMLLWEARLMESALFLVLVGLELHLLRTGPPLPGERVIR